MKRSLQVLDGTSEPSEAPALGVAVAGQLIEVSDASDGSSARQFAEALVRAGARIVALPDTAEPRTRVVIRAPLPTAQSRLRAEDLERNADLVLGSARPELAERLVAACERR